MKALVLCAGRGTRLRPLTHTRAKAAVPVAGEPVIKHILHYLHQHGFGEVGVVISPGHGHLKRLKVSAPGQKITFIVQKKPRGIAHAVHCAEQFLGSEPFLLYLGDNLTNEDLTPALRRFAQEGPEALIAVRQVSNPQDFGVAELVGNRVVRVVEKPSDPPGNLAIAGLYLFRSAIHEAMKFLQPSPRGEYEITDAIEWLIRSGRTVLAHRMSGWWQDMGSPRGMLGANRLLLDAITTEIDQGVSLQSTEVEGRVIIGPGVVLEGVRLRGPLWIGSGCYLQDSYIGPYTSVGAGSRIIRASVEHSLLLPGCRLEEPPFHLEDCLLGRGAVVEAKTGRSITLLVGDDGRLQIPQGRR